MLLLRSGSARAGLNRRAVELTEQGLTTLEADRRHREGWLARAIGELSPEEQALLREAVPLLRRLAER
jgi:DNA-binding MarR family transcriptional regulator